ncbi:LLM class flavin-dependent oxidoreductase [Mycolicibacterium thermoresistibile]
MAIAHNQDTGMGMKFGINIPPFTDAATVITWTREAEAAGWDGVFLWDHMQWNPGVAPLDPWVLLGAMAQVTERVVLGTLVTPLSRRRPHVVAKHLTTLDHLTGGRALLGVGLGDPVDRDFTDLGEAAGGRERAAMLDEGLEVIDRLLRGPTEFSGEHYRITADFQPRPVQQPRPPIWVAGVVPNRRPLARARRWDGVVPIGADGALTPDELTTYLALSDGPPAPGWDVVAHRKAGVPAQEYADAGATWLVSMPWPTSADWPTTFAEVVRSGPR